MNQPAHTLSKRLPIYLGAGIGAGFTAGHSEAAILVSFYGPGTQSPFTNPAAPAGFDIGSSYYPDQRYVVDSIAAVAAFSSSNAYFTNGTDLPGLTAGNFGYGQYIKDDAVANGAVLNFNMNYANISLDGGDGTYEAVAQFYLDGNGRGYLVALAINEDGSSLSISDGKAAIDAIPEPSGLALLALGAGGLLARRRRSAAA